MSNWMNFIGYQLAWFVVVRTAGQGQAWIAVLAAGTFTALQLAFSNRRLLDLRLMAVALVLGLVTTVQWRFRVSCGTRRRGWRYLLVARLCGYCRCGLRFL